MSFDYHFCRRQIQPSFAQQNPARSHVASLRKFFDDKVDEVFRVDAAKIEAANTIAKSSNERNEKCLN